MNDLLKNYDRFITPTRDLEIKINLFSRILKEHFKNNIKEIQNFVKVILGFDDFARLNRLFDISKVKDWEWYLWGKKHKFSTKNFIMYPIKNSRWYEIHDNTSLFHSRKQTPTRYTETQVADATEILNKLDKFMTLNAKFEKGRLHNE